MPLKCPNLDDIFSEVYMNYIASAVAGFFFFIAWWILIDAHATNPQIFKHHGEYYIPGIFATSALIAINMIPMSLAMNNMLPKRRIIIIFILFCALCVSFGTMISATYLLIYEFVSNKSKNKWPVISVFVQNVLIIISNAILKFGTKEIDV